MFVAPEPGGGVKEVVGVNPDGPGLEKDGHLHGQSHLLRPHAGSQTVVSVVTQGYGFLGRPEWQHHQDWTKYLQHTQTDDQTFEIESTGGL